MITAEEIEQIDAAFLAGDYRLINEPLTTTVPGGLFMDLWAAVRIGENEHAWPLSVRRRPVENYEDDDGSPDANVCMLLATLAARYSWLVMLMRFPPPRRSLPAGRR